MAEYPDGYVKMNHIDLIYKPDGDRCYWRKDKCNGNPCPVDCYHCPIGAEIEEEMAEENEEGVYNAEN